jgi:hypothetical protein
MAQALNKDENWIQEQIIEFSALASKYILN